MTKKKEIILRIFLSILCFVLLCFATAVYFTADLGVSTYDAISLIITAFCMGPLVDFFQRKTVVPLYNKILHI